MFFYPLIYFVYLPINDTSFKIFILARAGVPTVNNQKLENVHDLKKNVHDIKKKMCTTYGNVF